MLVFRLTPSMFQLLRDGGQASITYNPNTYDPMKKKLHPAVRCCTAVAAIAAVTIITPATSGAGKTYKRVKSFQTHKIVPEKELVITDLGVVESSHAVYPGELSFGYLMEQAFGKEKAPEIVRDMLMSWEKEFKVSGRTVEPLKDVRHHIINPWMKKDGFEPGCGKEWQPDFSNAPFNLLAIVNRMDMGVNPETLPDFDIDNEPNQNVPLSTEQEIRPGFYLPVNLPQSEAPFAFPNSSGRSNRYYGGTPGFDSQGGEGRFVFGLTNSLGEPAKGGFTMILEYGLPIAAKRQNLYQWAMDWHSLGEHEEFGAAYLKDLIKVTNKFTRRKEVKDGKLKGATSVSQLIRIRTNDGVLGAEREFREFRLTPANMLTPAPLAGTVADEFFVDRSKENRALSRWLKDIDFVTPNPNTNTRRNPRATTRQRGNLANIPIPAEVKVGKTTVTVATGAARVAGNDKNHHWEGWNVTETMRRNFSMQSCTGCHCGETGADYFHITPRRPGKESQLSKFLDTSGKSLRHRAPGSRRQHTYEEIKDRALTLKAYLNPDLLTKEFKALRERRANRAH
ncbi:MAG: hypothetical protein AB8F34_13330 [Akkermansiaceae bacterium]